jgi:hypothetical protein
MLPAAAGAGCCLQAGDGGGGLIGITKSVDLKAVTASEQGTVLGRLLVLVCWWAASSVVHLSRPAAGVRCRIIGAGSSSSSSSSRSSKNNNRLLAAAAAKTTTTYYDNTSLSVVQLVLLLMLSYAAAAS